MTTKYAARVQILNNRKIMRGLPETSSAWKMLKAQNDMLGQIANPVDPRLEAQSQKWFQVADILSELAFGEGEVYQALAPKSVYRGLIAQETDRIFKLLT